MARLYKRGGISEVNLEEMTSTVPSLRLTDADKTYELLLQDVLAMSLAEGTPTSVPVAPPAAVAPIPVATPAAVVPITPSPVDLQSTVQRLEAEKREMEQFTYRFASMERKTREVNQELQSKIVNLEIENEELREKIEGLKAGRRNIFLLIPCVFIAIALMLTMAYRYPTNLPAIGGPPAFAGLVPVESPAITQICDGKVCKKY